MTDEDAAPEAPASLLSRMVGAGISEPRAREHIDRGMVRVAGEPVIDPETPLPWPTRWTVAAG